MLLALLAAIYPHQTLVRRIMLAPTDNLTEAYLHNLMRTDPDNPDLRLVLARTQMQNGLFDRVRDTLAPAIAAGNEDTRQRARWLLWRSEEARYLRLPKDAPQRKAMFADLQRQLSELVALKWDEHLQTEIARKALAFGDIAPSLALVEQLAASNERQNPYAYANAAETALANGKYRAAAEFYLIAGEHSTEIAAQRRNFLLAMRALQSGDMLPDALMLAEKHLARNAALSDDGEILELLVRFARAARRPDLADKYARRLLRLSLLEQIHRQRLAFAGFDAAPRRVSLDGKDAVRTEPRGPRLPFDDRIYTLGFEAFLDNRNLEDAWKVAASAVRQAPENLAWRERLAQVSEWSNRPRIALEHWQFLARKRGSDADWQAVLRLAPGLVDDNALRAALQYQFARRPDDAKVLNELLAVHERLGEPEAALRLLEKTYARSPRPALLERMADIAAHVGDDEQALHHWQRLIDIDGITPARALRVAPMLLTRGRAEEALRLLDQAQGSAGDADGEFWRLTGEVALGRQQERTAVAAYRRLVALPDADARDYELLSQLLQDEHPREAADLAAAGWRRFGEPAQLLLALRIHAATENWSAMQPLLRALTSEQQSSLRHNPDYLLLAARFHQSVGQTAQARRDLEAALRIAPDHPDIRAALLWLVIDNGDGPALDQLLAAHETAWQADPELHDALAAAYLARSRPGIALRRYLTPRLAGHRDDFLWLMNYAEALEQNQEADRAWQLREHLLGRQRQSARPHPEPGDNEMVALRRAARVRLIGAQRAGDAGFGALRELLRLDADAQRSPDRLSPATRDLILAWFNERGESTAARNWLWQQYARTASRPMWAQVSLALAERDREGAGQLLDLQGGRIAPQGRISLASEIGDTRRVQSEAFDLQAAQANDDALHAQLAEALLAHSDHIGGEAVRRDLDTFVERDRSVLWHLALAPDLAIDLATGRLTRSGLDIRGLGVAPDETYRHARLNWRHHDGETRLTTEDRHGFAGYTPILLEHDQRITERLALNLALGAEQPANESTALRIAGKKDRAAIGLTLRPERNARLGIGYAHDDFATQVGEDVGTGRTWSVEAAYALRGEPRDLEAALFWSGHSFARRTNEAIFNASLNRLLPAGVGAASELGTDFFLPDNFRFYGIRLSTDTRFERDYTRTWRPFASAARTWHSDLGPGYDLSAGFAGSVFGNDHLSLVWRLGKGGSSDGGHVREIGLTYRIHY